MRKLTSILLVICLLMAMMPQIAAAEGDACEMGGSTYSSVKEAFDEALKAKPTTETAANPTVIRLLKDTVETEKILIEDGENERFFALDLNDHVLTVDIEGLAIKSSENLTITDSASQKTERYFTDERRLNGTTWEDGQDGAYETWTTEKPSNLSGVIVTSGGVIARGKDKAGQGINVTGGLLTISGGTVIGHCLHESDSGSGGCAVICDSIIMTGGRITGNSGWSMTGLASMRGDGDVLLLGGSIDHNTASLYAGGTSTFGARSFTIGGDVKIENNTAAMFGDNLLITGEEQASTVLLSFATGENAPKKGMSVVVSKVDPGTGELCRGQISYAENCLEAYANYLIPDNDADEVKFVTDHLELAEKSADSGSIARTGSTYFKTLAEVQTRIDMNSCMLLPITVTLLKDVTGTLTIPEGAEVTLDMNGCVFHDGRAEGAYEAVITNSGTLHIVGSSSKVGYTFREDSSGLWIYDEAGEDRTIDAGGLIAGDGAQFVYGAISNQGTMTMTDVALTGFYGMMGGILNMAVSGEEAPELTVTGCTIAGNSGMMGGAVYNAGEASFSSSVIKNNFSMMVGGGVANIDNGVMSIYACSILNNSCDSGGGGIYNHGTLTIGGETTVSGNKAIVGGGAVNNSALTLTGDVVIYDNTDGDTQNNLWTEAPVTISADSHTGMKIGIMLIGEGEKTISGPVTGSCAESDLDYFYADDTNFSLWFDPTAEVLVIIGEDVCSIGSTGYKSIAEALAAEAPEGESTDLPTVITLLGNVRESVTIPEGRYIELDLNGNVLKSAFNNCAVIVYPGAELKLTDTCTPSENPHYFVYRKHTYWEYTEKQTGTVALADITDSTPDGTVVVLYGGCITGKNDGTISSMGIGNMGTMTITGGSIAGLAGIGGSDGAPVYNMGMMTITGGSIVGNASDYAGGMLNEGALTVGGAARIIHNSDGTSKANLITFSPVTVAEGEKTGSIGIRLGEESLHNQISGAVTGECLESDLSFFFPDNENFELSYDSSESVLKLTALDVCSAGGVGYPSVAAALAEKPGEESSLNPTVIKLLRNTRENVTIPKDRCIILDLNGKVMQSESLLSTEYVITVMGDPESGEDGVLTICDTDTSGAGNFFVYKSSGSWIYTDENTGAIGIDEITDETPDGTIIKVPGGCITGRSGVILSAYSSEVSHGVHNKGQLFFEGGTIAGTSGALYNERTFVMEGGNIIGNYSFAGKGSGITNAGEATLVGGRISFNTSFTRIPAVYNRRDALFMTVGGTLRVEKNPRGNLDTEIPITVGGDSAAPAAGMSVGIGLVIYDNVNISAISGRLTENCDESDLEYFFPDHSDYELYFQNDHFAYKVKDISKFTVGEVYQGKALSTVVDGTSVEIQGDIYTNGSSPYGRMILFADLQENAAVYGFTKVTVRSQMGATQAAGNTNGGTVSLIDDDGEVLFEAAALGGQFRYDKKVSGGAIVGSRETDGFTKTDEKAKAIDYVDLRLQYQIRLPEGSSLKDKDVKWGWTVKFGEKELDVPGVNFMTSDDTFTSNVVITNIPLLDYAELEFSSAMYVEFVQDGVTYRIEQPVDNSAAMLTRNIKGMVEAYYSQLDSLDTDQQTYVKALYNLLNPEE